MERLFPFLIFNRLSLTYIIIHDTPPAPDTALQSNSWCCQREKVEKINQQKKKKKKSRARGIPIALLLCFPQISIQAAHSFPFLSTFPFTSFFFFLFSQRDFHTQNWHIGFSGIQLYLHLIALNFFLCSHR